MLQKTFPTAGVGIAGIVEEMQEGLAQASFVRQKFEIVAFVTVEVVGTGLSPHFVVRLHR